MYTSYSLQKPAEYAEIVKELFKSNQLICEFINKNSEFSSNQLNNFNYIHAICKSFSMPYEAAKEFLGSLLMKYYNNNPVIKSIIFSYLMLRAPRVDVLIMFNYIINNAYEPCKFVLDIISECNPALYKYYMFKRCIFLTKSICYRFVALLVRSVDFLFDLLLRIIQKGNDDNIAKRIVRKKFILKYIYIIVYIRRYHGNFYEKLAVKLLDLPNSVVYKCKKSNSNTRKIVVWTVCFGEKYFEKMIKYNLPSHLASNNIPNISHNTDITYLFYTDKKGREIIKSHKIFKDIAKYATIKIVGIDKLLDDMDQDDRNFPFIILALCTFHNYLVLKNKNIYALSNSPDAILSNSYFQDACKIIEEGYDCVCAYTGLRSQKSAVLEELKKLNFNCGENVPAHILSKIKTNSIHHSMVNMYWSSKIHYEHAGMLMHDVGNEALICYSTALHPLVIKYHTCNYYYLGTIDHVVPVSIFNFNLRINKDKNFLCSVTLEDNNSGVSSDRIGSYDRKDFLYKFCNIMTLKNRLFFSVCTEYALTNEINREQLTIEKQKFNSLILSLLNNDDYFNDNNIKEGKLHNKLLHERYKMYSTLKPGGSNNEQ